VCTNRNKYCTIGTNLDLKVFRVNCVGRLVYRQMATLVG